MKSFNIRKGQPNDYQQIAFFQKQMALETEEQELDDKSLYDGVRSVFERTRDFHKGFYLIAESDSSVIGSLLITREWSDWRDAWFWWIQSVYVLPEWRRNGVYKRLHEKVREIAKIENDICGIRLYVEKTNKIAQAVYRQVGMSESNYILYEESLQKNLQMKKD